MKPLKVCVFGAASACVDFLSHICAHSKSVTMTTVTPNPEYQKKTSSVFEFSECSEGRHYNKLHLDGIGIQVTKAFMRVLNGELDFCHTKYMSWSLFSEIKHAYDS